MFSALFSFLGGSVFRMIWGELSSAWTKHQDHKQELEAMELQDKLAQNEHDREMDRLKLSSDLKVQEVTIAAQGRVDEEDAQAFAIAQQQFNRPTGNWFVDAWNSSIRPAAATTALLLWWFCLYKQGFILTDWDKELVGVILGFYFAHRVFCNRGR